MTGELRELMRTAECAGLNYSYLRKSVTSFDQRESATLPVENKATL
jgi:hypothetical protein